MSKQGQDQHRARYTLEFKLEAVRLVKPGQEASVAARVLGMGKQTLSNWVRLAEKGELQGAGDRPVSAEQMDLHHCVPSLRNRNPAVCEAARLSYDTKFDLRQALDLPLPTEWFSTPPAAPHGQTSKLGTLHPLLVRAVQLRIRTGQPRRVRMM